MRGCLMVSLCLCLGPSWAVVAQKGPAQKGEMPITTSSKEARVLFEGGRERFDNVEFDAAAPLFDQAIQKDPAFAMAYVHRAQSGGGFTVFRQNLAKAVSLIDKVSPGEQHWIRAVEAQADGNSAKQQEHLEQLVTLFPSDRRVHELVGTYYQFARADPKKALEHFTKATELDPKSAAAYNAIGYCQSALENHAAAESAFKTYISLRPSTPNPYDSYAELLMKIGKFDESITQYRKALAVDPSFIASLSGIGDNLMFKGDFVKARETYEQQFQKAPNINGRIGALNNIAASYVYEGNTAEALKALDRLRTVAEKENQTPGVIGAHNTASLILLEANRIEDASAHLDKANQVRDASSLPAPVKDGGRIVATLGRARILAAQKKPDAAAAEVAKVTPQIEQRKNPFEERFRHQTLGLLELEQGRYQQALDHLAKAGLTDPYVLYYQAVAHEKKGDSEAASKLYTRVANWNSTSLGHAIVRSRAIAKGKKT